MITDTTLFTMQLHLNYTIAYNCKYLCNTCVCVWACACGCACSVWVCACMCFRACVIVHVWTFVRMCASSLFCVQYKLGTYIMTIIIIYVFVNACICTCAHTYTCPPATRVAHSRDPSAETQPSKALNNQFHPNSWATRLTLYQTAASWALILFVCLANYVPKQFINPCTFLLISYSNIFYVIIISLIFSDHLFELKQTGKELFLFKPKHKSTIQAYPK